MQEEDVMESINAERFTCTSCICRQTEERLWWSLGIDLPAHEAKNLASRSEAYDLATDAHMLHRKKATLMNSQTGRFPKRVEMGAIL